LQFNSGKPFANFYQFLLYMFKMLFELNLNKKILTAKRTAFLPFGNAFFVSLLSWDYIFTFFFSIYLQGQSSCLLQLRFPPLGSHLRKSCRGLHWSIETSVGSWNKKVKKVTLLCCRWNIPSHPAGGGGGGGARVSQHKNNMAISLPCLLVFLLSVWRLGGFAYFGWLEPCSPEDSKNNLFQK
jgi:hypothetical protein